MPVEAILMGIALAATAGLRVFMPFVFVGGMARYANTPVPDMLAWTATDAGFLLEDVLAVVLLVLTALAPIIAVLLVLVLVVMVSARGASCDAD